MTIDKARERLRTGKGSMRSDGVLAILDEFGFTYRRSTKGHYVVTHAELSQQSGFKTWSFNPPHGNRPVLNSYIGTLRTLLNTWEEELKELGYE